VRPETRVEGRSFYSGSLASARVPIITAFGAVCLIWGSTFVAIRFAVETLPPFTMAGTRFLLAGAVLYGWSQYRGSIRPTRIHWRSATVVGGFLMLGANGALSWAEQTVPSNVACLLTATMPLWIVFLDAVRPAGVWPSFVEVFGLALGLGSVYILVGPGSSGSGDAVSGIGEAVIVISALSFAAGSLYSRHACLPKSVVLASAMQMLVGGIMLIIAGLICGEWSRLDPTRVSLRSSIALLYLVFFGSLIAYSAYMWLLRVTTPAKVSTHRFVSPMVAVLLGWALADEEITVRTLIAAAGIVLAVVMVSALGRGNRSQTTQPVPNNRVARVRRFFLLAASSAHQCPRQKETTCSPIRSDPDGEAPQCPTTRRL
jgi:drug/metabolite transporter (DMT)-like permease